MGTSEADLILDRETMRNLGYRTVDMLVERMDASAEPPLRRASRADMERRLSSPPPTDAQSFEAILEQLNADVLPFMSRCGHPRYFAFIPGSGTWPGALGDLIASASNIYAGSWMESAGPSEVELVVLGWFKEWVGYPPQAAGVLVSGGSAANMTALACAREARLGAMSDRVVVYLSDQAHSSMARAARTLGFRPGQVRVLPCDRELRLRPDALAGAISADRAKGLQPLFVAASAGSTNSGAIDPLTEIAGICKEHHAWFHVDAAYGGFATLTAHGRRDLAGMEKADSMTLDPHKWLYQPFECGCLLVRAGNELRDAFEITPDYLKDAEVARGEVNFSDLGVQLTRTSRALKIWMSLKYFGVDAFRDAIDRSMRLARYAQRRIESSTELELLNSASLSVVCFRRRPPGVSDEKPLEHLNSELLAGLEASGEGLLSSTRLHGRYALRMCVLNPTSKESDVDAVLDWVERADVDRDPAPPPVSQARLHEPETPVRDGWLGRPHLDAESLKTLPLFRSSSSEGATRVLASSRERAVAPGDGIVEEWEYSRDFYVILDGTAEVTSAGRRVRRLHKGDFFGELAALDWGASFGYPRLATVKAVTELRLLVLRGDTLNELIQTDADIGDQIRRAVRERLDTL